MRHLWRGLGIAGMLVVCGGAAVVTPTSHAQVAGGAGGPGAAASAPVDLRVKLVPRASWRATLRVESAERVYPPGAVEPAGTMTTKRDYEFIVRVVGEQPPPVAVEGATTGPFVRVDVEYASIESVTGMKGPMGEVENVATWPPETVNEKPLPPERDRKGVAGLDVKAINPVVRLWVEPVSGMIVHTEVDPEIASGERADLVGPMQTEREISGVLWRMFKVSIGSGMGNIGDAWTDSRMIDVPALQTTHGLIVTETRTLQETRGNVAVVGAQSVGGWEGEPTVPGATVSRDATGTTEWDLARGLLSRATETSTMKIVASPSAASAKEKGETWTGPRGDEVRSEVTTTTTLTVKP